MIPTRGANIMPRFTFSEDWLCRLRDLKWNKKERQPLKKPIDGNYFQQTHMVSNSQRDNFWGYLLR